MSKVTEEEFVDETFKSGGPFTSTHQAGSLYRTLDHFGLWEMLEEWKEGKQRVDDVKNVLQKYEELKEKYINPDPYAQAKITELERSLGNKEFLLKHLEEKLEALKTKPDPNPMPELKQGYLAKLDGMLLLVDERQPRQSDCVYLRDSMGVGSYWGMWLINEVYDNELKLIWKEGE